MTGPLQRVSLVDMTVDALITLIEERNLRANDPLPSTAELAETLDVSRTVVREAIAELAGQGLVERRQGRETMITMPDARQLERLLRLRFAVGGADFETLQTFRRLIEVGAARLAAQQATDADVAGLRQHLEDLKSADLADLAAIDQAFHREVARICGNDLILLTVDGIAPMLRELRKKGRPGFLKSGGGVDWILSAHVEIVDRIAAHDAEGAMNAMRAHLLDAAEWVKRAPDTMDGLVQTADDRLPG